MEHRDDIVERGVAKAVEKSIPMARPVGLGMEADQAPPPPLPGQEMLLLTQSRRDAMVDILRFVVVFVVIALGGEFVIGAAYREVLGWQYLDDATLEAAVARAALFPAIIWRTITATAVAAWLTRRRGLNWASVGVTARRLGVNLLLGVAAFFFIMAAAIALGLLIQSYFPRLSEEFEKNADMIMEAVPRVSPLLLFGICLLIGFYEEIIFRGFLMPRLRRATHSWLVAVILTTIVFSVLHLGDQAPAALLAIVALSLTFSSLTIWRRSLVPGIVAHALFDFAMFLNLYYLAGDKWK